MDRTRRLASGLRAAALVAVAVAVTVAVRNRGLRSFTVDLAKLAACERDLPHGAGGVGGLVRGDRVLIEPGGAMELYLEPPGSPELVFGVLPDGVPDAVEVTAATDGNSGQPVPLRLLRREGEWHANLFSQARRAVRLRFANRSLHPLTLVRPRLEGDGPSLAPQLPIVSPPPGPPNVLLYVVDALRADHLSAYGYQRRTSPNIDALARRGVLFLDAYAAGPSTMHSVPALFASLLPSYLKGDLRGAPWTLAEVFRAAGFQTAGFQANPWVQAATGFARGFETYENLGPGKVSATQLHDRAIRWLREHGTSGQFFLFLQSLDVHDPYVPPPPFRGRFGPRQRPEHVRAVRPQSAESELIQQTLLKTHGGDLGHRDDLDPDRYDDAIAYNDDELGRLLIALRDMGIAARTIVVVVADHGEALGTLDDGTYLHGHSVYEEIVHIPLIIDRPWVDEGLRVAGPVSLVDVGPTLLDLVGLPIPPGAMGRSLLHPMPAASVPFAFGERLRGISKAEREALRARWPAGDWFVREGPWKLIGDEGRIRLFHLPSDPGEERDIAATRPIFATYLAAARCRLPSPIATPTPASTLTEGERRQVEDALRSLGYVE